MYFEGGSNLENRLLKFSIYFTVIFVGNIFINAMTKDHLNLVTAFSVALGVSWGFIYFSPYLYRKFSKS